MTPTARSLAWLRGEDWLADIVERRIPRTIITKDLYGIGDIIAIRSDKAPHLIQVTTGSNVAARITKIKASEHLPTLIECGWRVVVHGWRKSAKGRWMLRVVDIDTGDG